MEVIIDEGDGLYNAFLRGTYTKHPDKNVLTLGDDGEGDSDFILPDITSWFLTEVSDIEGVSGDVGLAAYSSVVYNLLTDIEALRQEALGYYTTFIITTTHYKTGNVVDVYRGTESIQQCVQPAYKDLAFTPSLASWKITKDVTAPLYQYIVYPSASLFPSNCLYPNT